MRNATIYYNPKCQTCRTTLEILRQAGVQPTIIEYLKNPPTEAELDEILKKLGDIPEGIVRKKEPLYQEKYAGQDFSRTQWLKILHDNPVLIERPIVVIGSRAIVARPPERVKKIL